MVLSDWEPDYFNVPIIGNFRVHCFKLCIFTTFFNPLFVSLLQLTVHVISSQLKILLLISSTILSFVQAYGLKRNFSKLLYFTFYFNSTVIAILLLKTSFLLLALLSYNTGIAAEYKEDEQGQWLIYEGLYDAFWHVATERDIAICVIVTFYLVKSVDITFLTIRNNQLQKSQSSGYARQCLLDEMFVQAAPSVA